jgi:hypothetical protein
MEEYQDRSDVEKIANSKHLPARSRFGEGRRNSKQAPMTEMENVLNFEI